MTAADFHSYIKCQKQVANVWKNKARWTTMSIINTLSSGKFSTDRTMQDYNRDIWKLDSIVAYPVK